MPFQAGSANDFIDLLRKLRDFATNIHVATANVSSGGSGYVVGDVLTVTGGTVVNGLTATLEVTSVNAGVIDGIRVLNAGAYSVAPSLTNSPTGGSGSSASITLTVDTVLWNISRDITFGTAGSFGSVGNPGTGYQVGDTVTVDSQGQLILASPMTFNVDSVGGSGEITGASVIDGGEVVQSVSGSFAVTGGSGSGASLDPAITPPDDFDLQIILTSTNGEDIRVGIQAYVEGGDAFNWQVMGFTGFNSGLNFANQPGASGGDCYVPLTFTTTRYWFFVNERRIMMVAEQGGNYPNMYLGFLNRFGTESEYPYPCVAAGCSSIRERSLPEATQINMSGLCDPISGISTAFADGPCVIRDVQNWRTFVNSFVSGSSRSQPTTRNVIVPCGEPDLPELPTEDTWFDVFSYNWEQFIPATGSPGTEAERLLPTPDGADLVHPIFPATAIEDAPDNLILGEMDGVYWVSRGEGPDILNPEDLLEQDSSVYIVFPNVARTQVYSFVAIRRD